MITVLFKNIPKSVYVKDLVRERFDTIVERFPLLGKSKVRVTLSMDNSPSHPGPDSYSAKAFISGGQYDGVVLEKSARNMFSALADLVEHTLERLNRYSDRKRVKSIKSERSKINEEASL